MAAVKELHLEPVGDFLALCSKIAGQRKRGMLRLDFRHFFAYDGPVEYSRFGSVMARERTRTNKPLFRDVQWFRRSRQKRRILFYRRRCLSEPRSIRDPIHGFIRLNEQESDLVDTGSFQRLRNLRQLALAHLVYPRAMHTRFEHSLGVCHVAGLLAESLKLSEDEKKLLRLAALMHDLGHGPFSHVSEEALEIYADRSKLPTKTDKIHEIITASIIRHDDEISRLLSLHEREKVIALLDKGYGEPIVRFVLSGPLDADKQDYLLRDSYYCGVKYGVFDLAQLHEALRCVPDPAGGKQLMVDTNGIHTLEQFVLAKYYLATQVIRHRIRLITDQTLLRAICLGIDEDQIDELRAVYSFDGSLDFISKYSQWGDTKFLQHFAGDRFRGKYCQVLLDGLLRRKLLKLIYQTRLNELGVNAREALKGDFQARK